MSADSPEMSDASSAERIDSIQYIRVLLEQMVSRRHLVNITTQTQTHAAVTTVLRVDGEERSIFLDKPYIIEEGDAEFELSSHRLINICGKNYGSTIQFESEFIAVIEEEGLPLYRFSFPKEVLYSAQRASFRVDTRDFEALISFTTSSGVTFNAPLCDISDGGLRVTTEKSVLKRIHKGDDIYCALGIDDDSCNKLKVRLCKPSKVDDPNSIEFGATFIDITPHQKSQISQYIATLERKLLRKQHSIPDAVPLTEISSN